ncbi:MAG: hypothetical protein LBI20_00045 [Holosporales bacterium]|jgi:hypothetical protein|nr:hypothetical protein [Holosporales bacterium]
MKGQSSRLIASAALGLIAGTPALGACPQSGFNFGAGFGAVFHRTKVKIDEDEHTKAFKKQSGDIIEKLKKSFGDYDAAHQKLKAKAREIAQKFAEEFNLLMQKYPELGRVLAYNIPVDAGGAPRGSIAWLVAICTNPPRGLRPQARAFIEGSPFVQTTVALTQADPSLLRSEAFRQQISAQTSLQGEELFKGFTRMIKSHAGSDLEGLAGASRQFFGGGLLDPDAQPAVVPPAPRPEADAGDGAGSGQASDDAGSNSPDPSGKSEEEEPPEAVADVPPADAAGGRRPQRPEAPPPPEPQRYKEGNAIVVEVASLYPPNFGASIKEARAQYAYHRAKVNSVFDLFIAKAGESEHPQIKSIFFNPKDGKSYRKPSLICDNLGKFAKKVVAQECEELGCKDNVASKKATGFAADIILGYNHRINDVRLGGYLDGTLYIGGKAKFNDKQPAGSGKTKGGIVVQPKFAIGGGLRVGLMVTPGMEIYSTLGVQATRYIINTSGIHGILDKARWLREVTEEYNASPVGKKTPIETKALDKKEESIYKKHNATKLAPCVGGGLAIWICHGIRLEVGAKWVFMKRIAKAEKVGVETKAGSCSVRVALLYTVN